MIRADLMELSNFAEIGVGTEHRVLQRDQELAGNGFVEFPCESEWCVAEQVPAVLVTQPRFSVFEFSDCTLNGFRLFEASGKRFTDISLVDDDGRHKSQFAAKFARGLTEDIETNSDTGEIVNQYRPVQFDGSETLLFCGDEPANFGSWIYRTIPKLILAMDAKAYKAAFGYASAPWMKSIISTLFPDLVLLPQNTRLRYEIRNASIPSLPAPTAYFRPEIRKQFDCLVDRFKGTGNKPSYEKIYVSRRKQSIKRPGFRVLESETELVEKLMVRGFTEFFPEDHPIDEQIRIFSQAKVIVGIGGSNMFGCYFARNAEIIVDIESTGTWVFAHSNVMASSGRPFTMLRGRPTDRGIVGHRNWAIDIETVLKGLTALGVI